MKKTYLNSTVLMADGKPCVSIDWGRGTVEFPTYREEYTDWRCICTQPVMQGRGKSKQIPIPEFEVYPAFMIYLTQEGVLGEWIRHGGRTTEFPRLL